jgi:hypothetical protein
MSRVDGSVRRVERYLDGDEIVLASCGGREESGRRRRVLVVTSDRVLVTWVRGDPPDEFDLDGASCAHDPRQATLTLRQDDREVMLRDVDEAGARVVVQLLADHRRWAPRAPAPRVHRVRLVQE